ncbi:MAG: hypothetical protein HDT26_12510 [Subdoligranulum sp.]|nr:hypothetical protein [Subdoligranulum sp.]
MFEHFLAGFMGPRRLSRAVKRAIMDVFRKANRNWQTKFDNFGILMPGGVEIVKTECMQTISKCK